MEKSVKGMIITTALLIGAVAVANILSTQANNIIAKKQLAAK